MREDPLSPVLLEFKTHDYRWTVSTVNLSRKEVKDRVITPRVWAVKQLSYFTLLHTTHNTQHIIQQSNARIHSYWSLHQPFTFRYGVHTHTHISVFTCFSLFPLFLFSQDSPLFSPFCGSRRGGYLPRPQSVTSKGALRLLRHRLRVYVCACNYSNR